MVKAAEERQEMHLGVVSAQVENAGARYAQEAAEVCEQKWDHAKASFE